MWITSTKHKVQNYNSKNSRMNHKCPRLFTNAVSNAEDNHKLCTASGANKSGPGYHFESCIFLKWNCVQRLKLGVKVQDARFSWHWPELASRTNNPLRLLVGSWQFSEEPTDCSFLPQTRTQQGSVICWYSSSNYTASHPRKQYSS
jgi:hypothetical protein